MAVEVLQNRNQIRTARRIMDARGMSHLSARPLQWCKRLGISTQRPVVGDFIKSWDVLQSLELIERNVDQRAAILDMGAFCSETLPALHQCGFHNLLGIDLNPRISQMPYSESIRYERSDFLASHLPDKSINAAVAISAIEHGYDAKRLLAEIVRILTPGGLFIASFDYWPEKIATDGIKLFGLDWRIFSRQEILELLALAREHGLVSVGEVHLDATEAPIRFAGRSYTFGWLALTKTSSAGR